MFAFGTTAIRPLLMMAVFILMVSSHFGLGLADDVDCSSFSSYETQDDARAIFQTYDFDHNNAINQPEFNQMMLALFENDEKRFVAPETVKKLFQLLDMDGNGVLDSEEYRKIFKHWTLPLISTKTCLFICLPPNGQWDQAELDSSKLIREVVNLFTNVNTVLVSSCHVDPKLNKVNQLIDYIEDNLLPKAYGIELYNVDSHRESLQDKQFDQFVIYLDNVQHAREALLALLALNTDHQQPTILVTSDGYDSDSNRNYLANELQLVQDSAIIVSRNFTQKPQLRARYKLDLALVLARKIYRKYKQFA